MKNIYIHKVIIAVFAIFIAINFSSCDEIDNPLKEKTGTCGDETLPTPIRKILVEDYTGHTCGNCPRAAEEMHELINTYCDYIVPIALHVGFFATPATDYPADFRTDEGNAIDEFFGNSNAGMPNGMVNRIPFQDNRILTYSNWAAAVETLLEQAPEALITVNTEYNENTNEYSTLIDTEILQNFSGEYNLSVFIVEDSIVADQKDYAADPTHIHDYVHNHMLRKSLNGTWGDKVIAEQAVFAEIYSKTYTFTLDDSYVPKNCSIVAFIYNTETKEIVQAETELIIQ